MLDSEWFHGAIPFFHLRRNSRKSGSRTDCFPIFCPCTAIFFIWRKKRTYFFFRMVFSIANLVMTLSTMVMTTVGTNTVQKE